MAKTKYAILLGIGVFVLTVAVVVFDPLQSIQLKLSDLFFRGRPVLDQITIIAIDDKSLSPSVSLGRFKDWPRSYYSQLLRVISPNKPAVVAFDLDFREASRGMSDLRIKQLLREYEKRNGTSTGTTGDSFSGSLNWYDLLKRFDTSDVSSGGSAADVATNGTSSTHPDDLDFAKAIDEGEFPVVLASQLTSAATAGRDLAAGAGRGDGYPSDVQEQKPIFSGKNVKTGFINALSDRDSVLRHFTPTIKNIPSFALAIAGSVSGFHQQDWMTGQKPILLDYAGRPFSYKMISFADVLAGTYTPSDIAGKIVLVGATAPILQDLYPTPTSSAAMPGIEINANSVQQLVDGAYLNQQGFFSLSILIALFSIGAVFLFFALPLMYVAPGLVALLILYPFLGFVLYQRGVVLNVVYPELTFILATISALWYRNKTEIKEKKAIKNAFAHYVSPVVVEELAKNPGSLRLGGTRKQISVMFSDIVGFTTLSEKLTPEDTVALLNDYLTAMTEVIFGLHGTLDKYQGDAIMALFGAPLDDPHAAVNACATALGMRKALVSLHEKWNRLPELPFKDKLLNLDFRVGIATGPAVIGNVGSERRFDYTAIGDIVNLGSRLESVNKKYGTHIMVDKNTFTEITENHNPFIFRKLDTIRVKGKTQQTEIFEVMGFLENLTEETKATLDDFENGRILYTQRNFADAKQYFEAVLAKNSNDAPAQIYRNRCNFFIRKPPDREWDAVVNLEEK